MTDTPDKLRALSVHIVEEEGDAPNFAANARALINEAADEIERLQSDLHAVIQADQDAMTPQEITEQNRIVQERLKTMTTQTMIEKMARAIYDNERERMDSFIEAADAKVGKKCHVSMMMSWSSCNLLYEDMARAALQALREPTGEMNEAAKPFRKGVGETAERLFRAMIDAALQEKT